MSNPHDKLFRGTFADVANARPLLRELLPAAVADAIDWAALTLVPGSRIDARQREHRSDLLFRARVADRDAFLYVLLEHKSQPDKWTALQVLTYVVAIWNDLLRRKRPPKRLPPIIPLVVHHGSKGWTASTELAPLIDAPSAVAELQPRFRFLLEDLTQRSEEEIRALALPIQALSAVASLSLLAPLAHDVRRLFAALRRLVDLATALLEDPEGQPAFEALSLYLLTITKAEPQRFGAVFDEPHRELAMKHFVSTADRLRRQGRNEGRRQGRAEGRAELLIRQLTHRFGELPASIRARVKDAAADQVDRWAERVLDAASLDAVFE